MKRISETERLIGFGLSASEDALNSAIQSLVAIRNNRFPVEKKSRKPRKPKPDAVKLVSDAPATRKAKPKKTDEDDPVPVARKCTSCGWEGNQLFPEPCPDCGSGTAATNILV